MTVKHEFCDHCGGCRPALINIMTGKVLPLHAEPMISVMKMWRKETTYEQRKAYIAFTYQNSRDPKDIELASVVIGKIRPIMSKFYSSR